METVLTGRVILPDALLNDGAVCFSGGRIVAVGPAASLDLAARRAAGARIVEHLQGFISPGYVDLH
ncbi:MAG: imidazolonepropionase-like domain-containing protein, partial [Planctomycetia bacterium]